MKPTKETTHAFIVRLWIEPSEIKDAEPIWRGVIEHVGSSDRIYFNNLNKIAILLTPFIESMGVRADQLGVED